LRISQLELILVIVAALSSRMVASDAGNDAMDSETFRTWLAERGCRFDHHQEQRGQGQAVVTVHHEGRTAELGLIGSHKPVDFDTARDICVALALDWSELPGPEGRA
jgi:hypothetical protein